jgi:dephospho-CoA kinase
VSQSPTTFFRVGVTGGIGSGKSTICKLLANFGRTVLSADEIAKNLTNSDPEIQSALRETFGETIFAHAALNRRALAEIVFNDAKAMEKLNAIVHPKVFTVLEEAIGSLTPSKRLPYVVIEAALIYETRMDDDLDYVIMVTADENTRIMRVMNRDKVTRDEVRARMKSQMDEKEKIELADFVITNDGTEADLIERIKFVDKLLPMMAKSSNPIQ